MLGVGERQHLAEAERDRHRRTALPSFELHQVGVGDAGQPGCFPQTQSGPTPSIAENPPEIRRWCAPDPQPPNVHVSALFPLRSIRDLLAGHEHGAAAPDLRPLGQAQQRGWGQLSLRLAHAGEERVASAGRARAAVGQPHGSAERVPRILGSDG